MCVCVGVLHGIRSGEIQWEIPNHTMEIPKWITTRAGKKLHDHCGTGSSMCTNLAGEGMHNFFAVVFSAAIRTLADRRHQ